MKLSRDRRASIVQLFESWTGAKGLVLDVGADHGHVAAVVGAIATEAGPGRCGRTDVPWVLADGLAAFRSADVAIIAGMGARTIAGILERGPAPHCAILHCPDDPQTLRLWLGGHGWRIDDEDLAREGQRYAEVIRVCPGDEPHRGEDLALGPVLCSKAHPLLAGHLSRLRRRCAELADATRGRQPTKHSAMQARIDAIDARLANIR